MPYPKNKIAKINLHLRVNPDTAALFKQNAKDINLSLSDYLTFLLIKNQSNQRNHRSFCRSKYSSDQTKAIVREINYIGNNLNQIAHACNRIARRLDGQGQQKYYVGSDNSYHQQLNRMLKAVSYCKAALNDINKGTYVNTLDEMVERGFAPMSLSQQHFQDYKQVGIMERISDKLKEEGVAGHDH